MNHEFITRANPVPGMDLSDRQKRALIHGLKRMVCCRYPRLCGDLVLPGQKRLKKPVRC